MTSFNDVIQIEKNFYEQVNNLYKPYRDVTQILNSIKTSETFKNIIYNIGVMQKVVSMISQEYTRIANGPRSPEVSKALTNLEKLSNYDFDDIDNFDASLVIDCVDSINDCFNTRDTNNNHEKNLSSVNKSLIEKSERKDSIRKSESISIFISLISLLLSIYFHFAPNTINEEQLETLKNINLQQEKMIEELRISNEN